MRFFDPSGAIKTHVTRADVVPSTVRAVTMPPLRQPALVGDFRASGRTKFCALTRGLAERGARLHHDQQLAFAVGGHVYSRATIHSRLFPNGLCGSRSFQVYGLRLSLARRLAREIRG